MSDLYSAPYLFTITLKLYQLELSKWRQDVAEWKRRCGGAGGGGAWNPKRHIYDWAPTPEEPPMPEAKSEFERKSLAKAREDARKGMT